MQNAVDQHRSGPRHVPHAKTTVEACWSIDIGRWAAEGMLRLGSMGSGRVQWRSAETGEVTGEIRYTIDMTNPHVRLRYTHTRTGECLDYRVQLVSTRLPSGSLRWWFLCPVRETGHDSAHRVGKLYLPPGARHFACRRCWRLSYPSQRQDAIERGLAKARAIRQRLGGSDSLAEPFPAKPKGMWWRTYRRLGKRSEELRIHLSQLVARRSSIAAAGSPVMKNLPAGRPSCRRNQAKDC